VVLNLISSARIVQRFAMSNSLLSTLHRALITLSALQLGQGPRAVVLKNNQVTEADLREHYAHWQRLQVVGQALQARYEPGAGLLEDPPAQAA
jgi:hypothetical protein